MRVLLLTQFFHPEPSIRGLPLAKALKDRGHDVEVLTGYPNYPGGSIYPGYRVRLSNRETIEGIPVNRVPIYPSHDQSPVRRVLNYLSFALSSASIGLWLVKKPDVVLAYNLVSLGFTAGLLRWLHGCKIVLDVQDLWPESVVNSGMMNNRIFGTLLGRWVKAEYQRPDKLLVQSPGLKNRLAGHEIDKRNIDVIYNWCDESSMSVGEPDPELGERYGLADRFNIVFAGTMGFMQSLGTVIEAAKRIQTQAPDVLFTFVGNGPLTEDLKVMAAEQANVQFLPRQPMKEVGKILAHGDALLVHLKDEDFFSITIPSKIQAYMYAGKPILCGIRGDSSELVNRADAGITFQAEDPQSLIEAIMALRKMPESKRRKMGDRGKRYYDTNLSFDRGVRSIEASLLDTLTFPADRNKT